MNETEKCSTVTEIGYGEHNRVFSSSQNVVKTIQSLAKKKVCLWRHRTLGYFKS